MTKLTWRRRIEIALVLGAFAVWLHYRPQVREQQPVAATAPVEVVTEPVVVADQASTETNFVAVAPAVVANVATPVVETTNNTLVLEFRDFRLGYGQKPRTNK